MFGHVYALPIAGLPYHEAPRIWSSYEQIFQSAGSYPLTPLWIRPEPGNPHDANAVEARIPVVTGAPVRGGKIGYVPRRLSSRLSRLLTPGLRIGARLATEENFVDPDKRSVWVAYVGMDHPRFDGVLDKVTDPDEADLPEFSVVAAGSIRRPRARKVSHAWF